MEKDEKKNELRLKFQNALSTQGIELEEVSDPNNSDMIYVRIFTPFERLAEEAEFMKLEMPLEKCQIYDEDSSLFETFERKYLVTDDEDDFVSAPFYLSRYQIFKGNDSKSTFFRGSLRVYLTHHILIHTDIRETVVEDQLSITEQTPLRKIALPHLLMTGVYEDAFILHEPSKEDSIFKEYDREMKKRKPEVELTPSAEQFNFPDDQRVEMDRAWARLCKYQPMWKIRNYFGEKIAFYFAWSGHLISWLWLPSIIGFAVFIYGLYLSIEENGTPKNTTIPQTTLSPVEAVTTTMNNMMNIVKQAFDNNVTPFFALGICLWGTGLTEMWKRLRFRLAYEWDVNTFNDAEPDRPQFVGTTKRRDPVTSEDDWYYPMRRQLIKFAMSLFILLFMICIVFVSVAGVICYRVVVTVKVCPNTDSTRCLLVSVVGSSILNAVSILLLGKFYDWLAVKLTDWENHRTQSAYDDALIIKLFAFQFANSYSSLIYIAFFRGANAPITTNGIFGIGENYVDTCGSENRCMTMLSFQVLVLMIMKPLPKLFKDIVLPYTLLLFKRCGKSCCKESRVDTVKMVNECPQDAQFHIQFERNKPSLGDFTIDEYMEKVIQYGYLMLFASSFPLAPLFALLTNVFDRLVDAKRMIWMYRRPIPYMVSGIGMWESIVEFLNIIGVVTNAFIIAFTSKWGSQFDSATKLIIVLGVEHAVFAVKFFIMAVIPDTPLDVQLSIRRERYQVQQILETGDINASTLSHTRFNRTIPGNSLTALRCTGKPNPNAQHPLANGIGGEPTPNPYLKHRKSAAALQGGSSPRWLAESYRDPQLQNSAHPHLPPLNFVGGLPASDSDDDQFKAFSKEGPSKKKEKNRRKIEPTTTLRINYDGSVDV